MDLWSIKVWKFDNIALNKALVSTVKISFLFLNEIISSLEYHYSVVTSKFRKLRYLFQCDRAVKLYKVI